MSYPQILYWKWDSSIFEGDNLETKIVDILNRGTAFSMLYVSFHWMNKQFTDRELKDAISYCCKKMHQNGKKLMLDIDVRNEGIEFEKHFPGKLSGNLELVEIALDEEGRGMVIMPTRKVDRWINEKMVIPSGVVNGWAFHKTGEFEFEEESLTILKDKIKLNETEEALEIVIEAGAEQGNKTCVLFPYTSHVIPDLFCDEMYEYFDEMMRFVSDIPLDGISTDEWGESPIINVDENGLFLKYFPYSKSFDDLYSRRYESSLTDDLLYLKYDSNNGKNKRIVVINNYLDALRDKMIENEAFIYQKGKEYFGKDTFIGAHPTWWGSNECFHIEALYNGLDWWGVKRDYAQTDEMVIIPIRMALAHKWGGNVWYNMFYSGGTERLDTYIEETWNNARFGGRTHQLGYECPNEPGVLPFRREGFEAINEMEGEIRKINQFQKSQPDARVLVVFGMEAVTNWSNYMPKDEGMFCFRNEHDGMKRMLATTQGIFETGYLCDLIPSTELLCEQMKIGKQQVTYGTQSYDFVVVLAPEFMDRKAFGQLKRIKESSIPLLVSGSLHYWRDGRDAGEEFREFAGALSYYFQSGTDSETIAQILAENKVAKNTHGRGTVYQDGSILFAAEGKKTKGNILMIEETVANHQISFKGEDFLGIRWLEDGEVEYICGKKESLSIDGQIY